MSAEGGNDEQPYTVRLVNGPACGTTFERWSPEDAQWVQRNEAGEWTRVQLAAEQRPDALRYLLSWSDASARIAEYALDVAIDRTATTPEPVDAQATCAWCGRTTSRDWARERWTYNSKGWACDGTEDGYYVVRLKTTTLRWPVGKYYEDAVRDGTATKEGNS